MLPTTFWDPFGEPETTIDNTEVFVVFCGGWELKCVQHSRITHPSGSHCQIWSMSRAGLAIKKWKTVDLEKKNGEKCCRIRSNNLFCLVKL